MKNKNTFLASATAAIAAASSLGLMPAASAADIYMNPNAAITKQWQKNSATHGQPLAKEVCVTGAGCAQQFENAVITWSRNTGVKVLSGAERAQAYVDAGGVKTLGALESDAWNNSFCGPSVTTFNASNSSRWLLVVDEGRASVGSKIDLNSDAGKKWLAERAQTKQCFDATTDNTGLEAAQKVLAGEYTDDPNIKRVGEIYEAAPGIFAQKFYTEPTAQTQFIAGDFVVMYDSSTGVKYRMRLDIFEQYVENLDYYGKPLFSTERYWDDIWFSNGYILSQLPATGGVFEQPFNDNGVSGESVFVRQGTPAPAVPVTPTEPVPSGTIDWSKAYYNWTQDALLYDDGNTLWIVKANAHHTGPADGATAYRSDWLAYAKQLEERGAWGQYGNWVFGDYFGYKTEETFLGLPITSPVDITENGVAYQTQQFEHGTVKWKFESDEPAVITLDPETQLAFQQSQLETKMSMAVSNQVPGYYPGNNQYGKVVTPFEKVNDDLYVQVNEYAVITYTPSTDRAVGMEKATYEYFLAHPELGKPALRSVGAPTPPAGDERIITYFEQSETKRSEIYVYDGKLRRDDRTVTKFEGGESSHVDASYVLGTYTDPRPVG